MANSTRNAWPKGPAASLGIAAIWLLSAPLLGHMGPPWPCVTAGALLIFCAFMLFYRPAQRRGWGALATGVSAATLLLGMSAIVPALLGIFGGAMGAMWNVPESAE